MFGLSKLFGETPAPPAISDDYMPWRNSYKLGIRSVDSDHRMLLELVR